METHVLKLPEAESLIQKITQKLGNDGRIVVRPSGTEPVVRIMIEGLDQHVIQEEAELLAASLLKIAERS